MSIAEKKLELFIAAFVLMLVWGVSSLMKNWASPRSFGSDIVYEMPRPKGFKGTEFDLSDREIDRRFVNPFDKKKAEEAKAQAKGSAEKNAIAAKASAEAAKKVEAARKAEADRKAKVTARIIEREKQAALAADAARKAQEQQHAQVQAQLVAGAAAAQQANNTTKEDNKRSPDQWKALVLAQPTQANIKAMYSAVVAKELDQDTYFSVMDSLLMNPKSETQEAGIYAASLVGNPTAFSHVAQHEETLSASVKDGNAKKFFSSYAVAAKLDVLASILKMTDIDTVLKGIVVAKEAKSTKGGVTSTDPSVLNAYSTAFDTKLKKILETLAANTSNQQIAAAAADALSSSPTNVAGL